MHEILMPQSYSLSHGVEEADCAAPRERCTPRPRVQGKFLYVGSDKLWIRGVTYGTFAPGEAGHGYHTPEQVERDFALMAEKGLNAVRTYTVPPRWLLDIADQHGLYVMVGLPWEQHITFLDDPQRIESIERHIRQGVQTCAGHPALLCYAIGNEIPASIVRWYGRRRIERFLKRLYRTAKASDPEGLVTYVNYPTTEYLNLPFLDFLCFNVYLETQDRLESYLARLHNLAGDRPLVMGEIGLDSRSQSETTQALVLDWQIRTTFASGCAGSFVFAWTDEWYRGGYSIDDWDFGLTRRDRSPKPALADVRNAYAEVPFPKDMPWPRISVVVCSYNGARTIRDTMEGLLRLAYPTYEVIVIDDGSTDATASIVREYGFRLISTENRGLSNARNTGLQAAQGEIVAYIDDDAYPDLHWLTYLAATFIRSNHAGVGGPNLAPAGDGWIADCVANAPGGPVHVLLSDREAEHIPGCNMAFRKSTLQSIGGFDPRYRAAGDDVDVCWRLQQRGWTLGFHPSAVVWHHRRNSVGMYWKQQKGYGKAEALLEEKWPLKYNEFGHLAWAGRLYGKGLTQAINARRGRVYQGTWGSALFQSIYEPAPNVLCALPLMPEWYLLVGALTVLAVLSLLWAPLLYSLPLLALAIGAPIGQAVLSANAAVFTSRPSSPTMRLKLRLLTAVLHLVQPIARLYGRLTHGLTPWRRRGRQHLVLPWPRTISLWSETWQSNVDRLQCLETLLCDETLFVQRGGTYDRWDLEVRGGLFGKVRTLMTVEDHGAGKQMIRFRVWPMWSTHSIALNILFALLCLGATFDQAYASAVILGCVAIAIAGRMFQECAWAMSGFMVGLKRLGAGEQE